MESKRKTRPPVPANLGNTVVGILVGLVIGVVIACGVVWYFNKSPMPFQDKGLHAGNSADANATPVPLPGKPGDKPVEKPRFDFYKILPQGQEAAPTPAPAAPTVAAPAVPAEQFYLQLGAFQKTADADNLKARLALMGVEASVQDVTLEDKGTMHRVRAGPYASPEDMNRVRNQLAQNGIQATVVKTRETSPASADLNPAKP